nr:abc transporter g family member [Quercus suber]
MRHSILTASLVTLFAFPWIVIAGGQTYQFHSTNDDLLSRDPLTLYSRDPSALFDRRPKECPPCFNCNLDDFVCYQFANCTRSSGKCSCPPGFGGEDCGTPTCGSLADGKDRMPRQGAQCECKPGWEGINCNVCKSDDACEAFMPPGQEEDGRCYREGLVVNENYQICDITNRKIRDMLKEQKPQATFSCNAEREECNFQFWVDQRESFYCGLSGCSWSAETTEDHNSTSYKCDKIDCKCFPGRMLCDADKGLDISVFLEEEIKGPASFSSKKSFTGSVDDGSVFSEPAMNGLISSVFGDKSILLSCGSGECLHKTMIPGYQRPIKKINTPLIAGAIAGVALFIVAVLLLIFFCTRRSAKSEYQAVQLSDNEEEENAKLLADHRPAALFFENVAYNLKGRQILAGVSGSVHPGELLAIMGASGAGKTSFLDILARKNKRGNVSGDFWINGEKVPDDQFRGVIGFVDQDDTMLPTLTVHETILDSALLRLPREMSTAAKIQKVEDVERQLGIHHIRNQIIGSEEGNGRGISGGEKRRVGIACELVTSPSILFLDEPTSGLDAYNAYNVVECLVTLVKSYNRTVVFTIHQPRSNIVALFDRLLLLAQGRAVYSGPFDKCQSYFDSIGYSCPPGFNIADYLVDLTMHAGHPVASAGDSLLRPKGKKGTSIRQQQERQLFSRKSTDQNSRTAGTSGSLRSEGDSVIDREDGKAQWLKLNRQSGHPPPQDPHGIPEEASGIAATNLDVLLTAYAESDVASGLHEDIRSAVNDASEVNGHNSASPDGLSKVRGYRKPHLLGQFIILARRTWRNLYRNPMLMLTHYAIAIVLAVFIGFLFYGLTDDLAGFQNRLGFFFFVLALFGFSTLTSLTVFAPERLLFVRERAKGYYNPLAYYLSKVVFDIVPLRLIPPILMGCIVYPMTGLLPSWPEFFKYLLFIVLFNLAAATICLFIGICVRNQGVANLLGVLVMLFSLLFGGFLLNHDTIPGPVRWLQYLSIFHFSFEGLIVNEVRYLSLLDKKYGLDIEVPGSAILSSFGFNVLALWEDAIGLAVYCGAFLLLGYAALHFLLVEKR